MWSSDSLQRFLFEEGTVRGEIVHLDATWCAVLERHDYPPVVRDLLGQFMAAGALLSATLKFSGSLIMQVQTQGPVNLLVIECTSKRTMRATAQWSSLPMDSSLDSLFANGRLIITLDPEQGKERYQGIVELTGRNVAEVLQNYLARSEQLDTRLWLTANDSRAAGMLLQKLPDRQTDDEDIWRRVVHLAKRSRTRNCSDSAQGISCTACFMRKIYGYLIRNRYDSVAHAPAIVLLMY